MAAHNLASAYLTCNKKATPPLSSRSARFLYANSESLNYRHLIEFGSLSLSLSHAPKLARTKPPLIFTPCVLTLNRPFQKATLATFLFYASTHTHRRNQQGVKIDCPTHPLQPPGARITSAREGKREVRGKAGNICAALAPDKKCAYIALALVFRFFLQRFYLGAKNARSVCQRGAICGYGEENIVTKFKYLQNGVWFKGGVLVCIYANKFQCFLGKRIFGHKW